jgi:SnoaL-like domain
MTMHDDSPGSPLAAVLAWHDAVNRRDVERVMDLTSPDVEIVGPRGPARGHDALRQWFGHARVTLEPLRAFARGGAVVVAQRGVWHDPASGEVIDEAQVASCFRVDGGRVAHYQRFDNLGAALEAAGLTEEDEAALAPERAKPPAETRKRGFPSRPRRTRARRRRKR